MRRVAALLISLAVWQLSTAGLGAQSSRATGRRTTAAPPPAAQLKSEPAMMMCPEVLGEGVRTRRTFCDVLIGRDPMGGILITLPKHSGALTLTFDLHNRATYSEEEIRSKRAYRRFSGTIGVLTLDNTLVTRAVVQNEYRTAADLVDRISGGTGPGGLKAVAPTGIESVTVSLPADVTQVSILGEKLDVLSADGRIDSFTVAGRPMALISNAMVQYKPAPATPARRTTAPPPKKK